MGNRCAKRYLSAKGMIILEVACAQFLGRNEPLVSLFGLAKAALAGIGFTHAVSL